MQPPEMPKKERLLVEIRTKTIIEIVLIGLLIFLAFELKNIILVVLTSIVIASFVEDVVGWGEVKFKLPRMLTVVFVYVFGLAFLVGVFYLFAPVLLEEASSLISLIRSIFPKDFIIDTIGPYTLSNTQNFVNTISGSESTFFETLRNAQVYLSGISSSVVKSAGLIFGSIANLVLIIIISFYLSIQKGGIETFIRIVTPVRHEAYVISLWNRTQHKIALWMRGQLLLGLIIGVLVYIGLTIIGVKYALVLAIIAGLSELIPYGLLFAFIPVVGLAYASGGGTTALWTSLLFIVIQQAENYFIGPAIARRMIGIPPLVVILALLIGATLGGFWGIFLAIPVTVCLLEYIADIEKVKSSARYIQEKIRQPGEPL